MRKTTLLGSGFALFAAVAIGCAERSVPPDEALERVRKGTGEYADAGEFGSLGPGTDAAVWRKAAEQYYPPASLDYFEDMDMIGTTDAPGAKKLKLTSEAIKGRNAWVLWTAGNEAWWDWLARYGYGTIDLLRLIDYTNRETRFHRTGLINEPGTKLPSKEETDATFGVRFARPITDEGNPKLHTEYRKTPGWHPASSFDPTKPGAEQRYPIYGYPSGVVGLRLFPNPAFTKEAETRWRKNLHLYYEDTEEARKYISDPSTIRPYRVGMSCGFCHIAPHPLNPPANVEEPEWANLSNNIGNQYIRIRAVFGNMLKPDNYLYHVFDSQLPGAVDTSGYPSDNNNNPNTINSFFGLPGRLDRAQNIPKETIGRDTLAYIRTYEEPSFENPHHVPRVLLDGSDSVGVPIALSRVYLNIGTHHQQWISVQNPLIGFRKQRPFKLRDVAGNSLYWHATLLRVKPMAEFFTLSTNPMRLKDAPLTPEQRKNLRGNGLPWYTDPARAKDLTKKYPDYFAGRAVFAKGCIACHSSVQPGDLIALEQKLTPGPNLERLPALGELPANWESLPKAAREKALDKALAPRRSLRLTEDDRVRLARGDGELPEGYKQWAAAAVHYPEFWEYTTKARNDDGNVVKDADGKEKTVTVHNFLSIDERIPVTVTRTNSGRATATNALHGHVWEDFASETYKELAPVGTIRYRDPFSGAEKTFSPPGGGPGYYRVPTLISIWATAPFLHNNSLGTFNNKPSIDGRLEAFHDAIDRLLSPAKRRIPSKQVYWDGKNAVQNGGIDDAWYPGKTVDKPTSAEQSAGQRAADNGWIWRTTEESWLEFPGPHVPGLVGGVIGLSPSEKAIFPWIPALAFLILGVLLLLSERIIAFRERYLAWLWWIFSPIWWLLGVGGLLAAIAVGFLVYEYWPLVKLLDVGTQHSIWGLRPLARILPVAFFVFIAVLFTLHRFPLGSFRRRVAQFSGAASLVLAILAALSFGMFLSGRGAGIKLGPIPEGAPINILANFDPNATRDQKIAAVDALTDFFLRHQKPKENEKEMRRVEFEQTVGPSLLNASKCPDFVTDRGHDYEFIRRLSNEEKDELIALLKTF